MNLLSSRKWSLPINVVIFNLCRLIPKRNQKIWVFGGVEGKKFDDNSRYFFEYVRRCYGDRIRTIWLSKERAIVEDVRRMGFEAYTPYCIQGMYVSVRAGVSIYSHALIDFGLFPLVGGSKIVSLWHGMGFKEIYNSKYDGASLKLKSFLDSFFSWTHRDITTVTSKYSKLQFQRLFYLKFDKIFITGQPRNDVFKRNLNKKDVLSNVDPFKKWILYMPTYRGRMMGNDSMGKIVRELYNNEQLDKALSNNHSILIVKLHPLTPHIEIENRGNFLILDYKEVFSNQELLAVSDVLVTDYSSCFVDFALMEKPIHFYCPDEEDFLSKSEKMNEDFFQVSRLSKSSTIGGLMDFISDPTPIVCNATNEIFEDESIKGTCYSENVYKVICKEIGLK